MLPRTRIRVIRRAMDANRTHTYSLLQFRLMITKIMKCFWTHLPQHLKNPHWLKHPRFLSLLLLLQGWHCPDRAGGDGPEPHPQHERQRIRGELTQNVSQPWSFKKIHISIPRLIFILKTIYLNRQHSCCS